MRNDESFIELVLLKRLPLMNMQQFLVSILSLLFTIEFIDFTVMSGM